MSENLSDLAAELTRVDAAIQNAPLLADPADPGSAFSDKLVDLVAREEDLVAQLLKRTKEATAG